MARSQRASGRSHQTDAVRITTAARSPRAELAHRQRRYAISMAIRTVCFIAAVVVGNGWFRWVLIAAALILPYVAVVMANSAAPTTFDDPPEQPVHDHKELR